MPWEYDTNLSKVVWAITYLGVATVKGVFKDVRAELEIDAPDPRQWRVDVTIGAASLQSGYDRMDEHARSADFLDVERYPTIRFVSRQVQVLEETALPLEGQPAGVTAWQPRADRFYLGGEVTLHGVTRPVELEVWFRGEASDIRGRTRRAFTATTSVNRGEFNVNVPPQVDPAKTVVGEQIRISLEVIANKLG